MIRVLVVDDSMFMRGAIKRTLTATGAFEVVGQASDGHEAVRRVLELQPDVVTMDFNMPGWTGVEAIAAILRARPTPIVMFSAHTTKGAKETLDALAAGAVDFVTKPAGEVSADLSKVQDELVRKLTAAASVRPRTTPRVPPARASSPGAQQAPSSAGPPSTGALRGLQGAAQPGPAPASTGTLRGSQGGAQSGSGPASTGTLRGPQGGAQSGPGPASTGMLRGPQGGAPSGSGPASTGTLRGAQGASPPRSGPVPASTGTLRGPLSARAPGLSGGRAAPSGGGLPRLCVVAVSTGGPVALGQLVPALPADTRFGIIIVQHMPAHFTAALAERLDSESALTVREAQAGDRPRPGLVLVAPGDRHLELDDRGVVVLRDGPPVNGCRPAADVTMISAARVFGRRTIGVVLTGMGKDGAAGALAIRRAEGRTLAQDEETSVIFGMPRAAIEAGAIEEVAPLGEIAARLRYL